MSKLEAATADYEDMSKKVEKMTHMLAAIPVVQPIQSPHNQFRTSGCTTATEVQGTDDGDASVRDSKNEVENLIEPVPPTEMTEKESCEVGEIIITDHLR